MDTIQIAIVVQNDLLRCGLETLLKRANNHIQLEGVYSVLPDYERFQQQAPSQQILILDDNCTAKPLPTIEKLRQHYPQLKIIILSDFLGEKYIYRLLKAGAYGFLYKQDRIEDNLLLGIRAVIEGHQYLSPKASLLPYSQSNEALNSTDFSVLELLAQGKTTGEIAARMNLTNRTIYRIRHKLREYLLVRTNEQIIEAARQNGLLQS
jgi:DNA-binding NarL/FixJ family response regulator